MDQRHSNSVIIQCHVKTRANNGGNSYANQAEFGLQQNICKLCGKICKLITSYKMNCVLSSAKGTNLEKSLFELSCSEPISGGLRTDHDHVHAADSLHMKGETQSYHNWPTEFFTLSSSLVATRLSCFYWVIMRFIEQMQLHLHHCT